MFEIICRNYLGRVQVLIMITKALVDISNKLGKIQFWQKKNNIGNSDAD